MKTQLVIFGITGDLAGRKLLPALESIIGTGDYNELSIVGVSRREVNIDELLAAHQSLVDKTIIFTMNLAEADEYDRLKTSLEQSGADQTLFYLSVPPGAAADIVDFIGTSGMNTNRYKILFEKPFGFDLASAQDFIDRTSRYFQESQLYRIDHYMAKEISKELVTLRHDASTHHHTWGAERVESVDIIASEKIDIEGRVQFYEQTGAIRDFVQGHLLQLLSLVLLDPAQPGTLSDKRLAALQGVGPADPLRSIRAQYIGYGEEVDNIHTQTETFAWLRLYSDDPRWQSVPFTLGTGKALNEKRSYICINYRDGSRDIFEEQSVTERGNGKLDAYERVLIEAIESRKDIFITGEEVIRSWEILDELQETWSLDNTPMHVYPKGSPLSEVVRTYPLSIV